MLLLPKLRTLNACTVYRHKYSIRLTQTYFSTAEIRRPKMIMPKNINFSTTVRTIRGMEHGLEIASSKWLQAGHFELPSQKKKWQVKV